MRFCAPTVTYGSLIVSLACFNLSSKKGSKFCLNDHPLRVLFLIPYGCQVDIKLTQTLIPTVHQPEGPNEHM